MARSRPVAEPLTVFCASLRELRRAAGQPSLVALRATMTRNPGVSTLSDVLNAKITKAPDWGLVAEFVTACTTLARTSVPARTLPATSTDLTLWQRKHADLERQLEAIGRHVRANVAMPVAPQAVAAAKTLPHDILTFTGRERELKHLAHTISSTRASGAVGIVAIDGMAGVGKTALAVHAAHLLTDHFPDGQLFLDLHAHTAGQSPVSPADALHALLSAVGVQPGAIPQNLDERAALWRGKLASRRTLVLLDNVVGHEQVRLLLPGTPRACVLITGRRRLAALDGAVMMPLDILSPTEAAELFVRAAGTGDPRSEAVRELTRQVGHLPLAIRLLAGRLRSRPTWTVEDLLDELAAAKDRSATIRAENVVVGAVFDLSFNALPDQLKPLFRILGLYPGVDFDVATTAALAGIDEDEARHELDLLYDDHLIEEPVRGRYRLHDLVRDYARGLAPDEPNQAEEAAMTGLLAYYLETLTAADRLLRGHDADTTGSPLTTRADAMAWLDTELPNLIATIEHVAARHRTAAAQLSHRLNGYLIRRGHWSQALGLYQTVRQAAQNAADRVAEADALRDLGVCHRFLGNFNAAEAHLSEALALHDEFDRESRADTLTHMSIVLRMQGRYRAALECANQSLELFGHIGDRSGVAASLGSISTLQCLLGNHATARQTALDALRVCRETNDRVRESTFLRALGFAEWNGGLLDAAEASLREALRLARETKFRVGEGDALNNLGVVQGRKGNVDEAKATLGKALEIFTDLGSARGQISTLDDLGTLVREQDPRAARRYHVLALRLAYDIANPLRQARSWEGIGRSLVAAGDVNAGIRRLHHALAIYRRTGEHDWRDLDALIAELEDGDQGGGSR